MLKPSVRTRPRWNRGHRQVAIALALFTGGCVRGGPTDNDGRGETTQVIARGALASATLSVTLPAGAGVNLVALGGSQSLRISDRSKVTAPPGFAAVSSGGTTEVLIGADAKVGTITSVGNVFLRERTRVEGDVRTAGTIQKQNGVVVTGAQQTGVTLTPPTVLKQTVEFAGGANVNREPGQPAISLAPGSYGHVTIKSRSALALSAGRYFFESVAFEPDAELRLTTSGGPVIAFVRTNLIWKGRLVHSGNPANVFVGVLGTQAQLETVIDGTIVAPNATLRFAPAGKTFKGSFFGRAIEVEPDLTIQHVPFGHWGTVVDIQSCADAVAPRSDLTGKAREIAYQRDLARFCTMPGGSQCLADLVARANADYTLAAGALLLQQFTPAQYLAVVRDRTRKMRAAEDDPALANAMCTGGDDDGDRIPNPDDDCPGTPDLTPTDDNGCTDSTLPPAPDPGHVRDALQNGGFISNAACSDALLMAKIPAGAFYYPGIPANGTYILSGRVRNQPTGCRVWYFFDVEESQNGTILRRYTAAFMDAEEASALVGTSTPVPPDFIQFNPKATDAGSRGFLGSAGGKNVRFRVQAMNGGGMRSGWSEWKRTTNDDCTALGFTCG